jgi:hypothetical protein
LDTDTPFRDDEVDWIGINNDIEREEGLRYPMRIDCCRWLLAFGFCLLGVIERSEGGSITFGGGFSSLPAITTPSQIAVGQTRSFPFSGTIAGVGMASGSVLLQDFEGTGGSITITNFAFQSALPAGAGASTSTFQITVHQDFALSTPGTISAGNLFADTITFSGPNQTASFALTGSIRGTPGDPFQSFSPISGSISGPISGQFPVTIVLDPIMSTLTGIPALGFVSQDISLATTLGTASGASGIGAAIASGVSIGITSRLTPAVPEPRSLIMMGISIVALIGTCRYRVVPVRDQKETAALSAGGMGIEGQHADPSVPVRVLG